MLTRALTEFLASKKVAVVAKRQAMRLRKDIWRSITVVVYQPHKLEVDGAIPSSATKRWMCADAIKKV